MGSNSNGNNGQTQTKKLRSKLSKKENKISKLRKEVRKLRKNLSKGIESEKIFDLGEDGRRFAEENIFDSDGKVIVEEIGVESLGSDYYFFHTNKDGSTRIIRFKKRHFKPSHRHRNRSHGAREGIRKFLEEEVVEFKKTHEHGDKIRHRFWELNKVEMKTLDRLLNTKTGGYYAAGGWEKIHEKLKELEKIAQHPLILGYLEGKLDDWIDVPLDSKSSLTEASKKLVKYAWENSLRFEEAAIALSLEDQEFAEKREKIKKRIKGILKDLRGTFSHYLPEDEDDFSNDLEGI